MYINANKLFQRFHNQGILAQSLIIDNYYENLCVIQNTEDEIVNQDTFDEIIRVISEARS